MMKDKAIWLMVLIILSFFVYSCAYIVLPEGVEIQEITDEEKSWQGVATDIGTSETGDVRIEITIQNFTDEWSTMQAVENKPAVLKTGDGKSFNCGIVMVGTGGHRFAPGFQMRGYSTGDIEEPEIQLLYVECADAEVTSGSSLTISYNSYQGELDDYEPEKNKIEGAIEINLDEVVTELTYPVLSPIENLIQEPSVSITALSNNVVRLLNAERTDTGFLFTWENYNPTKFALKTHIGTPPVIGEDGIIYGVYETLDMAPVPLTPADEKIEWTTEVKVPRDVAGCFILLSVESKKPRTYLNYALDITDK